MTKAWILSHLEEALESLQGTIEEITSDDQFDCEGYLAGMEHLYNHFNTSWNSRKVDAKSIEKSSEEDFYKWRQFPKNRAMK
jgi:hypothetical protein